MEGQTALTKISRLAYLRRAAWTLSVVGLFVVVAGAQESAVTWIAGAFGSAGGTSRTETVVVTGQLGSPFETVEVSGNGVRVIPGLGAGQPIAPVKVGDLDGDGTTGFPDFLIFAAAFGTRPGDAAFLSAADLDRSGDVGFGDFLMFAAAFGT